MEGGNLPALLHRSWSIEMSSMSAGFAAGGSHIPYATNEQVACPKCKAAPGVWCTVRFDRRNFPENHGIHCARIDAWLRHDRRENAKKMRAIFALEEAEDKDRARRGLPRNMATLA